MEILSLTTNGLDINSALTSLLEQLNSMLEGKRGKIADASFNISAGPLGGMIEATLVLDGKVRRAKRVVGVNVKGSSPEDSLAKATDEMNRVLSREGGEIVEVFTQTIVTPIPKRVFTTILAALNLEAPVERQPVRETIDRFVERLVEGTQSEGPAEEISLEIPEEVEVGVLPGRLIEVRSRDRSYRKEVSLPPTYEGAEVRGGRLLLRPG
jgi:hypothetical protein